MLLAGGGWLLYDRVLREDSGVAACKSLAAQSLTGQSRAAPSTDAPSADGQSTDGQSTDGQEMSDSADSADQRLTRDEYVRMRKVFADSRYADLREHGTKLMDVLWQVTQLGADNEAAMAYVQPLTEHVSGLQSACADHGVIIDLKITD